MSAQLRVVTHCFLGGIAAIEGFRMGPSQAARHCTAHTSRRYTRQCLQNSELHADIIVWPGRQRSFRRFAHTGESITGQALAVCAFQTVAVAMHAVYFWGSICSAIRAHVCFVNVFHAASLCLAMLGDPEHVIVTDLDSLVMLGAPGM